MATVTLKGTPTQTRGSFPQVGSAAPDFRLVSRELRDVGLQDFGAQNKVLNIFPSIDTAVCASSVRKFNEQAAKLPGTVVLCIAADLPFAMSRFCGAEGIDKVVMLSLMRGRRFAEDYGVLLAEGPLAGLCARACLVLDGSNVVRHAELVPEIAQEPDYDSALRALQ